MPNNANVGPTTVGRLLRGMGFSLRVNHKKLCNCSTETRYQQFQYITEMRRLGGAVLRVREHRGSAELHAAQR